MTPTVSSIIHVQDGLTGELCRTAIVRAVETSKTSDLAVHLTVLDHNPAAPVRLVVLTDMNHWHYPQDCGEGEGDGDV